MDLRYKGEPSDFRHILSNQFPPSCGPKGMRKRLIAISLLAILIIPTALVACSKPMDNKELDTPGRDNTGAALKKAGADDN